MQENFNIIKNGLVSLYVRHVPSKTKSNKAVILMNSRSLCVESSMGISMGTISYADYLAEHGIHAFLLDMRGFGMSSVVQEQIKTDVNEITKPVLPEDYYSDLMCCVQYIRSKIRGVEISVVGFSFAGALCVSFANKFPRVFKNLILLNTNWKRFKDDVFAYRILNDDDVNSNSPNAIITMDKINDRLVSAQPAGKNFIEPLWYEEVSRELMRCHQSYDQESNSWKIAKFLLTDDFFQEIGLLSNIKENVLLLSSQYDAENPIYVSNRLYKDLYCAKPYLRTIPNATHLCIWEKQRHYVYESTVELVK